MGACAEVPPNTAAITNTFHAYGGPEGEVDSWQEEAHIQQDIPMEVSGARNQSSAGH